MTPLLQSITSQLDFGDHFLVDEETLLVIALSDVNPCGCGDCDRIDSSDVIAFSIFKLSSADYLDGILWLPVQVTKGPCLTKIPSSSVDDTVRPVLMSHILDTFVAEYKSASLLNKILPPSN